MNITKALGRCCNIQILKCSPTNVGLYVLVHFLNKCFSDDHIERLVEKFEEIDTDKTGTITDEGKPDAAFQFSTFFIKSYEFG